MTADTLAAPATTRRRPPLRAAAATAVTLGAGLAALIAWTTPWNPLGTTVPGGAVAPWVGRDFTAREVARDHAFHAAAHPPSWLALAVGLLVAAWLAATPAGARLVATVGRWVGGGPGRRWVRQVAAGAFAVDLVLRVVTVPFDAWTETVLRRYGLSTQGWGGWAADQAKSFGVTLAVTVPVLLLFYAVARRLPRWWWAPLAGVGAALVMAGSFAYPVVVEPLFSGFHPLPAGPLRTSLLDLAHRDGVAVSQVLVSDASARTTELNAYVSGFGASKRIVLYDTLLRQPPAQIRLVVAHELGHAKFQDVLHGTVEGALGFAAGVCLLFLVTGSRRVLRRAGVAEVTDPRAVALLLGLVAWLGFLATPVQNLVSRHIEARADVHSLNLTHDPRTFVRVQHALAVHDLSTLDPSPPLYIWFFDHPTGPQRIALALDWARIHHVPAPAPLARGAR